MKTDTLIHELAKQARPVKPIRNPSGMFLRWCGITALCLAVGVSALGCRPDLAAVARNPSFLWQAFLTLGLGMLSALSAFILSVPGQKRPWLDLTPAATLVLWLGMVLRALLVADHPVAGFGLSCIQNILVLGVAPGALLFFMLWKAAPLQIGKVGMFAALSATAFGAFGTQLLCCDDDPLHLIVWHYLPVLVLGGMGILLGRRLLKWDR